MDSRPRPSFVKVLETGSLSDIALPKNVLDGESRQCYFQGENMKSIRPVDRVVLMVAKKDVEQVVELLKPPNLNYSSIIFR